MKHITARHMIGFHDELQKHASVGSFLARQITGKYGRQIGLGAGVGALGGAATAGEGESRLRAAIRGAGLGAGLGLGGVALQKGGREWMRTGAKNFGKRQLHGITGRGVQNVEEARKIGLIPKREFVAEGPVKNVAKNLKAREMDALHEHAFKQGYTSAPGVIHGLLTNPKDVIRTGWKRGGGFGKVFAGMGAYGAAKGALETPEPGGPGRAEKALRGAGSTLGWVVAPHAMVGGSLVGEGMGSIAGKAGKLLDAGANRRRLAQQMYNPGYEV